ncbi:serine/threonine-protein phosphatase CPPED1 isoform X2 [Pleurodeles waltl]|uniref:serine/threonine-protein phosphatase CPPED1 isoform X2 n=1 Tax=Pleurodeles waltl TaxID=8319 RepID=UPI00370941C6
MANEGQVFLLARDRTFSTFSEAEESEWKGPFYFIQGADPQFGLMKAWAMGDCDNGGDEWDQEIRLTEEAVKAINKLNPKPKFLVLCGDLIHAMPGTPWQKEQERDLKSVLQNISEDIPLVFVSGNHDIGNTPTPDTIAAYCKSWGDDYFSFWVGGVFFIVLNSQFFFDSSKCGELKEAHDQWLEAQLVKAKEQKCKYAIIFQHIPLFLKNIDEDEDYFNIQKTLRHELVEKFQKAGTRMPSIHAIQSSYGSLLILEAHSWLTEVNEESRLFSLGTIIGMLVGSTRVLIWWLHQQLDVNLVKTTMGFGW